MTDALPTPSHPKLASLLAYWARLRGNRAMPARADIDVLDLKEWIDNLHLIEFIEEGRDFYYRVYGSNVAGYIGHDLTRQTSAAVPSHARAVVREEYELVRRTGRPLLIEHNRRVFDSAARLAKLVLPLAADGRNVDMVLVGAFVLR